MEKNILLTLLSSSGLSFLSDTFIYLPSASLTSSRRRFFQSLNSLSASHSFQLKLSSGKRTQQIQYKPQQKSDSWMVELFEGFPRLRFCASFLSSVTSQRRIRSIIVVFIFHFFKKVFRFDIREARSHNGDNGWVWEVRSIVFLNILSFFIIQTQKVLLSEGTERWRLIYDARECIIATLHTEADSH